MKRSPRSYMATASLFLFLFVTVVADVGLAYGQEAIRPIPAAPDKTIAVVVADPADVASPDAIIAAANDVISGAAGQKRDWRRMLSLFYPGAQLIRTARTKEGGITASFFTPEEYAKRADAYFEKNGFWEKEVARRTERWANILQAFSTYESRHDAKDLTPFARGINSYQLLFDGKRWWILMIYWLEEAPGQPVPLEYLPGSGHPSP